MNEPPPPTTLVDWLDDLTVRFLLNLPPSELSSVPRLCFQVEEAQWFYEDFVRPAVAASGAPPLPSLQLRQFCLLLFQHCPLFNGFTNAEHIAAYEEFLAYKVRVPVRGAILLDHDMQNVVLVRGWKKGASWSFPRGKINKDEKDLDCAIREVYEETGFDVRQAGLVPEDEEEVKYIDITMREQHIRLFVFRDVPEDTHFEPKTRKEISKIQWYSIRDLPGFKKQKADHGQVQEGDASRTNKFYMVAPFLGPLKKWISLQKKNDKAAAAKTVPSNGYAVQPATEDEGDAEDEQTPEREIGVDNKSEELKRLLSIGAPAQASPSVIQPGQPINQPINLLAMLQNRVRPANGHQMPHTPFDQINAFPQQPETPQPDHLRHPSLAQSQQPAPPQFAFSPQRLQMQEQQQRVASLPTPNIFGPGQPGFPPQQHPTISGMVPAHLQQQQQFPPNQGVPLHHRPAFPLGPQNSGPSTFQPNPGMQQHQIPPQQMPTHVRLPSQQIHPNEFIAQGPQGALGSGPAIPNASQLPPPRLNAQSMRLLDAFKSGASANQPATAPPGINSHGQPQQQHPTSTHQAALLDLFKKPSSTSQPFAPPRQEEPASPTNTDVTVKPTKPQIEKRPTLNEITRTLPAKFKTKSPPVQEQQAQSSWPTGSAAQVPPEETRPRQLFDPSNPVKPTSSVRASQEFPDVIQPTASKKQLRSPKPKHAAPSGSPSRTHATKASENGTHQVTPPFTILARPGSSKGQPKSPSAQQSPLRNEGEKAPFQPQVLKRPQAGNEESQKPADKKDQLLALFGKSASTPTPAAPAPVSTSTNTGGNKAALLDLFNTSSPSTEQATPTLQQPPPAPRIEPERKPPSRTTQQQPPPSNKPQQSLLLDLFNKKDGGTPTTTSPGTPISPFTLGTPARSRMGSVVSNTTGAEEGKGKGTVGTPTEAREFLMGFLDGVVKEGQRGAGTGIVRR